MDKVGSQIIQGVAGQPQVAPQAGVAQVGAAMFTQEQVNEIVSKRVNELNVEKAALAQSIEQYKEQLHKANEQITGYSEQSALAKVGIDPRFASFLTFEARKRATEGKTTFEEALGSIVTETGSLYLPQQDAQPQVVAQGQEQPVTQVVQETQTSQVASTAAPQQSIQPIQYLSSGAGNIGVLQSSAQSQESSFLQARLASRQGK